MTQTKSRHMEGCGVVGIDIAAGAVVGRCCCKGWMPLWKGFVKAGWLYFVLLRWDQET